MERNEENMGEVIKFRVGRKEKDEFYKICERSGIKASELLRDFVISVIYGDARYLNQVIEKKEEELNMLKNLLITVETQTRRNLELAYQIFFEPLAEKGIPITGIKSNFRLPQKADDIYARTGMYPDQFFEWCMKHYEQIHGEEYKPLYMEV